jgi:hypothetical protein
MTSNVFILSYIANWLKNFTYFMLILKDEKLLQKKVVTRKKVKWSWIFPLLLVMLPVVIRLTGIPYLKAGFGARLGFISGCYDLFYKKQVVMSFLSLGFIRGQSLWHFQTIGCNKPQPLHAYCLSYLHQETFIFLCRIKTCQEEPKSS